MGAPRSTRPGDDARLGRVVLSLNSGGGNVGGGWVMMSMIVLSSIWLYESRGYRNARSGTRKLVEGVWNLSEVDPEI